MIFVCPIHSLDRIPSLHVFLNPGFNTPKMGCIEYSLFWVFCSIVDAIFIFIKHLFIFGLKFECKISNSSRSKTSTAVSALLLPLIPIWHRSQQNNILLFNEILHCWLLYYHWYIITIVCVCSLKTLKLNIWMACWCKYHVSHVVLTHICQYVL